MPNIIFKSLKFLNVARKLDRTFLDIDVDIAWFEIKNVKPGRIARGEPWEPQLFLPPLLL